MGWNGCCLNYDMVAITFDEFMRQLLVILEVCEGLWLENVNGPFWKYNLWKMQEN